MKSLKTLAGKSSLLKNLVAAVIVMTVFWMTAFNSLAAEGEVIADTAKIRAQANTSSEVIASTVKGKTIDIVGVEQDSSGMKWYKVPVAGGGYGYIRSDLVKTAETLEFYEGDETSQTVSTTTTEAQKPADTVPTSIGEQQAVIKCDTNVKIRSGASTSHDVVTSLPDGTAITLIGEANDSAGNKWYQMTCSYNGRSIEGYVRSDLIAIGAVSEDNPDSGEGDNPEGGEETPEGENPEGTESEAPEEEEPAAEPEEEHNDYEIRWAQNKDNEDYDYFLYDNVAGNRMRLSEVMNAVNASDENVQKLQDQVDKEKIIIIVLAAVIVLLFIVVTILLFKIRSLYYEDYDEEDEEEEEEEEELPVKKKAKRRVEEEEEEIPIRKKRTSSKGEEAAARKESERPAKSRKAPAASAGNAELRAAERKESPKKPPARKPQNFLVDDDEFEFEFLNMDDKDL